MTEPGALPPVLSCPPSTACPDPAVRVATAGTPPRPSNAGARFRILNQRTRADRTGRGVAFRASPRPREAARVADLAGADTRCTGNFRSVLRERRRALLVCGIEFDSLSQNSLRINGLGWSFDGRRLVGLRFDGASGPQDCWPPPHRAVSVRIRGVWCKHGGADTQSFVPWCSASAPRFGSGRT